MARGHRGVLADRKRQLGENRTLDLGQRQFVDGRVKRRIFCWVRLVWQTRILTIKRLKESYADCAGIETRPAALVRCNAWLLCKDRAASGRLRADAIAAMMASGEVGP